MSEQQLLDYIKMAMEKGIPMETIRQTLVSSGWGESQVKDAILNIESQKNVPPPPLPPSPTAASSKKKILYTSPYSALLAVVLTISLLILIHNAIDDLLYKFAPLTHQIEAEFFQSQEYKNYQSELGSAPRHPSYAYSLTQEERNILQQNYNRDYQAWNAQQKSLYDKYLSEYKLKYSVASPSFRIILHTILVLPLWIITFLLYMSLKENSKKYESLLISYYLVSGWLLIYLFFNIASYIYSSNTTLGVYVGFGMLAVILTGAIWGIQKYKHNLAEN